MNFSEAAILFRSFNGYTPRRVKVSDVKVGSGKTAAMVCLGRADHIGYVSDKDMGQGRKKSGYKHVFGKGATLWATRVRENGKAKTALWILSPKLKITKRGIEG
jgi:hypothetical protein